MAHATSREAALLQMKKLRKQRDKKKIAESKKREEMSDEEYAEYIKRKGERLVGDKAKIAIWDYKHHQYPACKYNYLEELLQQRKKEIEASENKSENELREIEEILNEIRQW